MSDGSDARAAWPHFSDEASRTRYLAAYDAALEQWPVSHRALMVETRFGPTHVLASGAPGAPAVLLLPSLAGTALAWRANVAALSTRYRTYAVDVIGQPGKSLAHRRLASRREFADWLSDLIAGLGETRAHLVGCSFGGFLALSQAVLAPATVGRVVLISPAGSFVRLPFGFTIRMLTGRLRRRLRALVGSTAPPKLKSIEAPRAPLHAEDALWRQLMGVTMAEAPKVNTINAPVLSRAELAAVKAPTLLLVGEHEQLYPPKAALQAARKRMPSIAAELVPGAGHIAAMDCPAEVNARIIAFLDGQG